MATGIYLVGRGTVNKGKIAAAKKSLGSVIDEVRTSNPGVAVYEHSIDSKTGAWLGVEKYANNEALRAHLMNPAVGAALGEFMANLAFEGIVIVGDVEPELRTMMAGFNPAYMGASLGFAR